MSILFWYLSHKDGRRLQNPGNSGRLMSSDASEGDLSQNKQQPLKRPVWALSAAFSEVGRGGIEPPTRGFSVRCSTV